MRRPNLLEQCPCCGIDPGRVLEACHVIDDAIRYLGEGKTLAVVPSLEFETGAKLALEWALGMRGQEFFEVHLRSLERIRGELAAANGS
jgi:hypothetical protein